MSASCSCYARNGGEQLLAIYCLAEGLHMETRSSHVNRSASLLNSCSIYVVIQIRGSDRKQLLTVYCLVEGLYMELQYAISINR